MSKWTKNVIEIKGFPVKIYTNADQTRAVVFFLFGRYMCLSYDGVGNVLDFAVDLLVGNVGNTISFNNYLHSTEDTALIQIEKITG